MINGLIPYFYEGELTGNIISAGLEIASSTSYEVADKIGMVYQNPKSQFFNVDTNSELSFGIENLSYPRSVLKERVKKTIDDLALESLLDKGIFQLSGGEKQKIAFGSIYAMMPEVYLLDEPSANLDYEGTQRLKERLIQLKKEGKTILMTEHRLNYLTDVVDRVLYMDDGEIRRDMSGQDFFALSFDQRVDMGLRSFEYLPHNKHKTHPTKEGLVFTSLSTGYDGKAVINDMDFHANIGEIVGIVGANGQGKSTLAQTICGFHDFLSGECYFHGKKMTPNELLKKAYMVMQDVDYQLFADTAENECRHGLKHVSSDKIETTLKDLNLYGIKDHHPLTLSGGQKQRLAIAVSLMCEKEILIFDEPTSGLDYDGMIRVSKLLKMLSKENKIIFVVTHDDELLHEVVDRVIQLEK